MVTEAATRDVLQEKVFSEIWESPQKITCARVSFYNKVVGLSLQLY